MQFDSVDFLVFFAVVLVVYHGMYRWRRVQNGLILVASYVFYGWWDWRFLGLIVVSSAVDYTVGRYLGRTEGARARRIALAASVVVNLGILATFKYFDFFAESLVVLFDAIGWRADLPTLHLILPVGISFYTFQSMAYAIDVYRKKVAPERDPITFFAFVAFFPQLVAGPIERAGHMLPQYNAPRRLDRRMVREAVWLLAWGYFLKEGVADSLAPFVDLGFRDDQTSGWWVVIATVAFGLQIYADFNAYSLIARGTARLLGFELMWNFNLPYFATSIRDFWHRWHVSLSTWLRDYLYIPLGGSRRGAGRTYFNLMLTMGLGGLWHGAAWHFVFWGLLHGGALAVARAYQGAAFRPLPAWCGWLMTMAVVFAGWFLFRVQSWDMMVAMLAALDDFTWTGHHLAAVRGIALLALPLVLVEVWQHRASDRLVALGLGRWTFALLAAALLAAVFAMFGRFDYAFIYFQF